MTGKLQPPQGERIAALEAVVPGMVEKVDQTHSMVHEMRGQLATFIDQMAKRDKRDTDTEVRLRKVEGRLHWYSGFAALGGTILGYFGVHLIKA